VRNSLEKVFSVLGVIAESDSPVSLKEISARTGHNPSTLSRILSNLVEIGYVRKENYRQFSLDLGLIPLGQKALSHFPLPRLANALIAATARKLGVAGALAGLHRGRMVYLYRSRLHAEPWPLAEDYRYPLHRSNCGMVILAGLDDQEARRLLELSLSEASGGKRVSRTALRELLKRMDAIRADGYSWLVEKDAWNVAFPVAYRGRTFSVSLHQAGEPPKKPEGLILECSLLARRIEGAAGRTD
jgi:DNA-binding IclR family transcriptional regulator